MAADDTTNSVYLTGPTAAGKTAVGLELARLLNAEILSLDSMAVYRGMDIGTAKPSPAERAAVPHHLLDLVDPSEEFSIAEYLDAAERAVAEVRSRSRVPLFVGGTPLYLKALLRGISTGPPADWQLRQRLQMLAKTEGPQALHARLAEVDPQGAARLHPNDTRRLVRALEVYETTGQAISKHQTHFERPSSNPSAHVFCLVWPREQLNWRIGERVEAMFAAGWVDEVRRLAAEARSLSRTAAQAVGYREILEHLEGLRTLPATVELVQTRTRQFAKRQMTWFRSLSECQMIEVQEPLDPQAAARQIYEASQRGRV